MVYVNNHNMITMAMVIFKTFKMADKGEEIVLTKILVYSCFIEPFICFISPLGSTLRTESNHSCAIDLRLSRAQWALRTYCVGNQYFENTYMQVSTLTSLCLFISLIFYIIRKNNALETTRIVSCAIIYFLMFARSKF